MWVRGPDDGDRWTWVGDPVVHLLLCVDGVGCELHGAWAHWYRLADTFPGDLPLEGARWVETRQLDRAPVDEAEGWQMLADLMAGYELPEPAEPGHDPDDPDRHDPDQP